MNIDLEAIRARAEAATRGPWTYVDNGFDGYITSESKYLIVGGEPAEGRIEPDDPNADFIAHSREDIPALLAEVKRLNEMVVHAQEGWHDANEKLASVTAERDAAANAVEKMAEYIVNLGGVNYHLCDVIPQEHHLKYQSKNDGDYDNEPCIECVKAYFMSGAEKGAERWKVTS